MTPTAESSWIPRPAKGVYQHYKGRYYELLGIARHSETGEQMVIYRTLYHERALLTDDPKPGDEEIKSGQLCVRPMSMWSETVEWSLEWPHAMWTCRRDIPDVDEQTGPRFKYVGPPL